MVINRIAAITFLLLLALPSPAPALPFSYVREHPAECAEAWEKKTGWRSNCGSKNFCAVHKNDDRISRIVCDPYESKADRRLESMTLSLSRLAASPALSQAASRSECQPAVSLDGNDDCFMLAFMKRQGIESDDRLLPTGFRAAKLALRAHIQVYTFPVTDVRLGIASANAGMMQVTWNRNGNGRRETHYSRLAPDEIARLVAAVNRSDFWRLPRKASHVLGPTDGETAMVEISAPGRIDHASDSIGDADAVDLSILVNELNRMIKAAGRTCPREAPTVHCCRESS